MSRTRRVARSLRGVSSPVGGIQWELTDSDHEIGRRIITYLEDRRVLYTDVDRENPGHCVSSVLAIRKYLTRTLSEIDRESPLHLPVRIMRGACREFCDAAEFFREAGGSLWIGLPKGILYVDRDGNDSRVIAEYDNYGVPDFWEALAILRDKVGYHADAIVRKYNLGVEWQLSSIFPGRDTHGNLTTR